MDSKPPFVICYMCAQFIVFIIAKAIGDPETLESALKIKGGTIDMFTSFGLKNSIEKSEKLFIPKYEGEIDFKYAQPVNNE